MPTKAQQRVYDKAGLPEEKRAAEWLERHQWTDVWHHKSRQRGHYDIIGKRNNQGWLFEVKSGKEPGVTIENLMKMLATRSVRYPGTERMQKIHMAALMFVPKSHRTTPLLFKLSRPEYAAWKAINRRPLKARRRRESVP
jgi:Holliday junction resolvase-like predicted endonuclease